MGRREGLIARRRHMDFTQESLAHHLNVAVSTVTKWEHGTRVPAAGTRRKVAEALQLSLMDLDRLLGIEPVIELDGHPVPSWLNTYESLVQAAGRLAEVDLYLLPGLLQTKAYAAGVERSSPLAHSDSQIIERVDVRLARQAVLYREPSPLALDVVVPESVLREVVGGPDVMVEQLDHLLAMTGRANIDVRLISSDGRGSFAVNGFELLTRPGETIPFMAVTASVAGPDYKEVPEVVDRFATTFDHLQRVALPPHESARRIEQIRETYR